MGFNLSVSIWGAFIGGLFSFFSPCIIPLLPVYVSILTETGGPQKANSGANRVLNSLLFVLGGGASFAVLGRRRLADRPDGRQPDGPDSSSGF